MFTRRLNDNGGSFQTAEQKKLKPRILHTANIRGGNGWRYKRTKWALVYKEITVVMPTRMRNKRHSGWITILFMAKLEHMEPESSLVTWKTDNLTS